ncbi:hypothetical protein B0T17DRAFT_658648 [Bombardia bombarda]|uniref:TauD/TfdA-like domain-containing protein n=1 Tax=Bombardia bombarda TaxID=252184 RepID=A0AA39WCG6_9PEZI|nr:hypothetical protein B0T17DRAFT_658648 [Bombardia bombarda]
MSVSSGSGVPVQSLDPSSVVDDRDYHYNVSDEEHSGQKNFSTVDLPVTPQVRSAKLTDDGSLSVIWKNETTTTSEDQSIHSSVWPAATLDYWADNILTGERLSNFTPAKRTLWNRAKYNALLSHGICRITHADWTSSSNPAAFERALDQLSKTGLIFVTDVPNKEDEVERIGQRIGMLQHTFYGTTWDVKSKPRAENVAYTSQFLGLHQDLMYHEPIPRLQLLHCLANSCEGGESLFSDGVRAAYAMQIEHPELYNVLTWFSVPFHYRSKDGQHHYEAQWPTIEIDRKTKYIKGTHWAPPFQAPFRMPFPGLVEKGGFLAKWKEAAAVFHAMLASPENMVKVKLKPGECIIFDNSRVLHGRNEFKTGGEGDRWLKGTYVSPQVFTARQYRMQMEEDGRPKRRIRLRGMDGKVTIGGDQNDTTRLLKSERSQVKAMLGLLED